MLILSGLGSAILGGLITLLIVAVVLSIFFYIAYHTFHGDLPEMFKIFIIGLVIIIAIGFGVWFFAF